MGDFSARLSELCLKLYSIDILKFGDFKMKVGMNSPIYFDLRSIISFPVIMVRKNIIIIIVFQCIIFSSLSSYSVKAILFV